MAWCETCRHTGWVANPRHRPECPAEPPLIPCGECIAGVASCCEGCVPGAGDFERSDAFRLWRGQDLMLA
jgi:hypothetical protein